MHFLTDFFAFSHVVDRCSLRHFAMPPKVSPREREVKLASSANQAGSPHINRWFTVVSPTSRFASVLHESGEDSGNCTF